MFAGFWIAIKTIVLTVIAWGAALAVLTCIAVIGWNTSTTFTHFTPMTFAAAYGMAWVEVIIVAVARLAYTAPLLTAEVEQNRWDKSRRLSWSLVIWPPRGE